ncbi:c-type cytochrome [Niveispirillum sp. KHB5.9]|uniref:c-type cytochrome n=1 Tax=Niveispirillum sp. KHB5.9 TaxID=3400269 RepID=UPI003A86B13F
MVPVGRHSRRIAARAILPAVLATVMAACFQSAMAQTAPDKGERLYLRCRTCHEVAAGKPNKVGPNLNGFWGKPAGHVEGFKYSPALRESGVVWDEKTLDVWLTHPTSLIKGTTMAFIGLPDKADRDALIAYLRRATN